MSNPVLSWLGRAPDVDFLECASHKPRQLWSPGTSHGLIPCKYPGQLFLCTPHSAPLLFPLALRNVDAQCAYANG